MKTDAEIIEDILAWCDGQDRLSKGESPTTHAVRLIIDEGRQE